MRILINIFLNTLIVKKIMMAKPDLLNFDFKKTPKHCIQNPIYLIENPIEILNIGNFLNNNNTN